MFENAAVVAVLRMVHILSAISWMGGAILMTGFLYPTVRALGPAGGQVMHHLMAVRRLPSFLMAATILTLLSGGLLFWHDSAGFAAGAAWMRTGTGLTFGSGGVLAILAAVLGKVMIAPSAQRLGALAATPAPSDGPAAAVRGAELRRLQIRLARSMSLGLVLLVGAATAMSVARYVR